ncbi:fatty acid desaturase [Thermithiobacillus plumbiphilus]|uniref:Fatty acid desaturase n=1 Tax=Thermithiobacillus plumbiphilus TaxID=1729899 RepID=A0ABU9D3L0_9PROT
MNHTLRALQDIKLQTVRESISPACYQRSHAKALLWYGFDLALYLAAMTGVFLSDSPVLKLFFGLLAGCAVAFMFVWAHDAAHGSLFQNKRVAEVLGTIFMLPSLNMYRLWALGHNKVHHGFTSFSPVDWIWRPLTPAEYAAKGWWQRALYRLERTPYFCALHYILRVWWPGMVRFRPDEQHKDRHMFTLNKLITLAFALGFGAILYAFGGGIWGLIAGLFLPWLVFNYFIALFVFLHHTHPDIPFFDQRKEWSNTIGQLYCSTVVRCSRISELLIHNIMTHTPHHVDARIPFYHLKRAHADLKASYGEFIHEYRFRWSTVRGIFRQCKLYDFENQVWHDFRQARQLLAVAGSMQPETRNASCTSTLGEARISG